MFNCNKLFWLKKEIEQLQSQIENLTYIKSTAIVSMSSGSGKNRSSVEETVIRIEELLTHLRMKLEEYVKERKTIEGIIDSIEDTETRAIARMRFIDNMKYYQIGKVLHIDQSTARKKLNQFFKGK